MSCEYGQTRCEDKNMEADRNKRGLGERREAERVREMQQATGVPKCWRDCAGMVARGLSAECAPLPLLSPSEELLCWCSDAGKCVWHTHMQSQTLLWPRRLHSLATVFICGCVCVCLCTLNHRHAFMYLIVCLLVCIFIVYYVTSDQSSDLGTTASLNWWDFLQCQQANCAWYMTAMIYVCVGIDMDCMLAETKYSSTQENNITHPQFV